jgi:signal transduction histidine kinase
MLSEEDCQYQLEILGKKVQSLNEENEKLKQSIEQVNKERIEYLQNVSHQLVAPLNAIKWHIENLTAQRLGVDRARKVLRSIYAQATIAVHLAKNFALMSNLEADHSLSMLKEPLEPISLFSLLVNLADDFQPLAWDKSIDISVERGPFEFCPEALAMKNLIRQVFGNIIENAIKYSNRNTTILINGFYDKDNDSVTVKIMNQGIKLNDDDLPHIFERSFRSQEAIKINPAGTGFGLYIAKKIVEIHGGSISALQYVDISTIAVTLSVKGLKGKARERG